MGEAKRKREMSLKEVAQAIGVETMKGRHPGQVGHVASATPFGQMAFFIEFLKLTGLYERWIEDCPLRYAGPNGSPTAIFSARGFYRFCPVTGAMPTSPRCVPMACCRNCWA